LEHLINKESHTPKHVNPSSNIHDTESALKTIIISWSTNVPFLWNSRPVFGPTESSANRHNILLWDPFQHSGHHTRGIWV